MKIVLFAGGTGKRFWPASRINSPKQFLPIINNKSLLRMRYDILKEGFRDSDIFISTGKKYETEVKEIVPEIPKENLILEPEMRDTAPAVTLAVSYIHKKYPHDVISIQWSDHLIKKTGVFLESLKISENEVKETQKAVLMAVPARFPSPHRGYIKFSDEIKKYSKDLSLRNFQKFVEKPSVELAEKYIQSQEYGWNVGYWNLNADYYLDVISKFSPETYNVCKAIVDSNFSNDALDRFSSLEKISADYAFAEHITEKDAFVMLANIGWSDVGEWIAFKETLEDSHESNVTFGNSYDMDSLDTLVFNTENDKLVATIGLNGMIVVNTKDVIAVFHKNDNTKLKEFIKRMEEEGLEKFL